MAQKLRPQASKCRLMRDLVVPPRLLPGDAVAVVSPAGSVSPEIVERASSALASEGYVVKLGRFCLGSHTEGVITFSGTAGQRLADLREALEDSSVKALWCSRGGFGAVPLLASLDIDFIAKHPKWTVGYSDITALHAAMHAAGVMSLHAPMARHLAKHGIAGNAISQTIMQVLGGACRTLHYEVPNHTHNRNGWSKGRLVGGNLAVIESLVGTDFDMLHPGTILFIEDVGDEVFRVERMMCHLLLTGVLSKLSGLVVGRFSRYRESAQGSAMHDMIRDMVADFSYPVAFGFPVGHDGRNVPLVEGAEAELRVSEQSSSLTLAW